ncbi:hypothetical protein LOTGIDRAFT_175117 [Lottia gigantea]|uniref:Uncharacterized protein n=1 Tax=Lottia gigantea TaxID=225164 RepID=V4APQ1_LOTGI|nr:hypothetical protein LOTGIDRAFT_175117 [Lottia gigantea]ESO95611.1 hypothetical protein LOTGIDRAFT_175117 [Lottia gigantea]
MTKTDELKISNSTLTQYSTTTIQYRNNDDNGHGNKLVPPNTEISLTDTIVAITVAVLACVVLITLVLIIKTVKQRRRERQGNQLDHIPTISTGIMGTGVAAYNNTNTRSMTTDSFDQPSSSRITWEPINTLPSSSNSLQLPPPRGDNTI